MPHRRNDHGALLITLCGFNIMILGGLFAKTFEALLGHWCMPLWRLGSASPPTPCW